MYNKSNETVAKGVKISKNTTKKIEDNLSSIVRYELLKVTSKTIVRN
ncbi:hypothetical protein [Clostridium sp.]